MANKQESNEKKNFDFVWHSPIDDNVIQHANWQNYEIKLNWTPNQTSHKTTANGSIVIKNTGSKEEIFQFSYNPEQYALLSDKAITVSSNEPAESKCQRLNMSNEDYEIIMNEMGKRLYRIL